MAQKDKFSSKVVYRSGNKWKMTKNKTFQFLSGNTTRSTFPGLKTSLDGLRRKKTPIDSDDHGNNIFFIVHNEKKK